jgi:hypothetical protein
MQKTVYRVRTGQHLRQRIVMDMLRDAHTQGRLQTTYTLHYAGPDNMFHATLLQCSF